MCHSPLRMQTEPAPGSGAAWEEERERWSPTVAHHHLVIVFEGWRDVGAQLDCTAVAGGVVGLEVGAVKGRSHEAVVHD